MSIVSDNRIVGRSGIIERCEHWGEGCIGSDVGEEVEEGFEEPGLLYCCALLEGGKLSRAVQGYVLDEYPVYEAAALSPTNDLPEEAFTMVKGRSFTGSENPHGKSVTQPGEGLVVSLNGFCRPCPFGRFHKPGEDSVVECGRPEMPTFRYVEKGASQPDGGSHVQEAQVVECEFRVELVFGDPVERLPCSAFQLSRTAMDAGAGALHCLL